VIGAFPPGSCDTHVHVYDSAYPTAPTTVLEPPDASLHDYRQVQDQLGLQRVVLVQPTTYGLDNRCQLDALTRLGGEARAVVVVDDTTTDAELARLTEAGARGARFHMLPGGAVGWDALRPVASRIAEHGWHVQLQLNGRDLVDHVGLLAELPTPLVIDHVGRYMPPVAPDDARFAALLSLLDGGRCWVKLSAPYESASDPTHRYAAVAELAEQLVERASHRLLWASNWPHPGQTEPPDLGDLRRLALDWLPDPDLRRRVLVDHPVELYGFDPIRQETP
jgi:D-galactarolactone isomerase